MPLLSRRRLACKKGDPIIHERHPYSYRRHSVRGRRKSRRRAAHRCPSFYGHRLGWGIWTALVLAASAGATGQQPKVHDPRLELTLVAEHPEIVTPIGMAVDASDRLFVIESHTHHPPADYAGPKTDRIKIFSDRNGDGEFDDISIFAEGLDAAMNLAFSPQGVLYVVCAREVLALHDADDDSVCERKERVLELVTSERYAHNCLLGITFDVDGRLYVSRGNVGSRAYTLRANDGSQISGYGDGGNVARCQGDGTQLEEFATGFWNPFELKFDRAGRLLCVDNDPDGRGPNRIVHVVRGGDYGYRSLYGGSGNHPFQGWNGDLPGTLPILSGTGEAPSGLLDCRRSSFPEDYSNSLLVTVWNENTIERHALRRRGLSLEADRSLLVSGSQNFRPVAIAAHSDGDVYFTDWVRVAYPNHGEGRIWKLAAKTAAKRPPRRAFAEYESDPCQQELRALLSMHPREFGSQLRAACKSQDPFRRHAATAVLSRHLAELDLSNWTTDPSADVRLATLLAMRMADTKITSETIRPFLADQDHRIRHAALIWVAESTNSSFRTELDAAIQGPDISAALFETYLAAVQNLAPEFARSYRARTASRSNQLVRKLDESLLHAIATDHRYAPKLRALALARIDDPQQIPDVDQLREMVNASDRYLPLAAVRKLAKLTAAGATSLVGVARDHRLSVAVRAEALAALAQSSGVAASEVVALVEDENESVAIEAARVLRLMELDPASAAAIETKWRSIKDDSEQLALAEQLAFCLRCDAPQPRPQTLQQWQQTLATGGDPEAGRRIFYSPHATCSKCHTIGHSGGTLGPDLSRVAQSVDRSQIVHSILRPSDKFPPQYQAWLVLTTDGKTHTGLQLDHKAGGNIILFTTEGRNVHFKAEEIEEYAASPNSVMPNGLEANLGVSELRDLVAFIESLK